MKAKKKYILQTHSSHKDKEKRSFVSKARWIGFSFMQIRDSCPVKILQGLALNLKCPIKTFGFLPDVNEDLKIALF